MGQAGDRETRKKVKWLIVLRATVVTAVFGSLAVLQFYEGRPQVTSVYTIIAATYLLTIVYSILYRFAKDLALFIYAQVFGDVLLETWVVYATGGIDSAFSFMYIFSIIAAGIILLRRGGFLFASLAGILYGVLVDLQYYGVILSTPNKVFTQSEIFYNIFLNFFAFYTVALLSSSLSERLKATREALEEKSLDLKELQALNENIIRSMADGMITIGLDGRITGMNKAAEGITGLSRDDVKGALFSKVFDWLGVETFFEDREAARGLPYRYEIGFDRAGRPLVLGITLSPLRDEDGRINGLLGIFQDLTPMKRMEEEIKKKDRLAAIGELSAGMAHEIRNPLASLSGSLQILSGDLDLSDENRRLMEIALGEMDRLNNIVTQFLIYARPQTPSKEGCDLASIVKDTANLITNSKEFRDGIELKTELPDGPLMVRADPGQIRQVLLNLSLNSVQAISGSGTVRIEAGRKGEDVYIHVEDDGEGIQGQDLDRIFYPFYSTKPGGSGLGLAIVYRIVDEHGGTIKAESRPGKGTRFSLTLPATEAP